MLASRTAMILDYGDTVRANIQTNHFHRYGPQHQESYIKWEGTRGAIKAQMGLLMDYPRGAGDCFEVCTFDANDAPVWTRHEIAGSWFPEAFIGSMAQVMRAADGRLVRRFRRTQLLRLQNILPKPTALNESHPIADSAKLQRRMSWLETPRLPEMVEPTSKNFF